MILTAAILLLAISGALGVLMCFPQTRHRLSGPAVVLGLVAIAAAPWIMLPRQVDSVISGVLFTGLIAGALMAAVAYRGRRVDDHPLCRRCGYDLAGLDPRPEVCPECGAELKARRSVRVGHRRRSLRRFGVGLLLLFPALGLLVLLAISSSTSAALSARKPVWWLRLDLTSGSAEIRNAAASQLNRQRGMAMLSDAELTTLIDPLLDLQVSAPKAWTDDHTDLLYTAITKNLTTSEQNDMYLRQAVDASIRIIARDRINESWPVTPVLRYDPGHGLETINIFRSMPLWLRASTLQVKPTKVEIDGMAIEFDQTVELHTGYFTRESFHLAKQLSPGIHRVDIDLLVMIAVGDEQWLKWTSPRSVTIEVLPDDEPIYRVVRSKAVDRGIKSSISLTRGWRGGRPSLDVRPEITLACDVLARTDRKTEYLGSFFVNAGKYGSFRAEKRYLSHTDWNELEIIVRSNPAVLTDRHFTDPIWEGEVSRTVRTSSFKDFPSGTQIAIINSSIDVDLLTDVDGEHIEIAVRQAPIDLDCRVTLGEAQDYGTLLGEFACKQGESVVVTFPIPAEARGNRMTIRPSRIDVDATFFQHSIKWTIPRDEPAAESP